jgi:DNA-binding NtrC family response regulator
MPHLLIVDLKMPGMDGITLIEKYKEIDREADFLVLTAFGTLDTALRAMKMGVIDYILKPLKEPEELCLAVRKAYSQKKLLHKDNEKISDLDTALPPMEVLFAGMDDLLHEIQLVAMTNATILLAGETGTGKSMIARAIHKLSQRNGTFVEINCASVPEHLLESEFFGHEKGAFTGAIVSKKGKFELAFDGTIFLDEISEMHQTMQAKLLRVLQDGMFERLGSNLTQKTNARVITATNKNLKQEVIQNKFREDLFFRLNVFPITLRPLRERKSSIPLIAEYLTRRICQRTGKYVSYIAEDTIETLKNYNWPGNIRELQNVLERAIILSQKEELEIEKSAFGRESASGKHAGSLKDIEKKAIEEALQHAAGHRKKTAERLGISIRALQYKLKEYGITD